MITSSVILAKERFVNLTVLQLDGIQDILHDLNHYRTALIARLKLCAESPATGVPRSHDGRRQKRGRRCLAYQTSRFGTLCIFAEGTSWPSR